MKAGASKLENQKILLDRTQFHGGFYHDRLGRSKSKNERTEHLVSVQVIKNLLVVESGIASIDASKNGRRQKMEDLVDLNEKKDNQSV